MSLEWIEKHCPVTHPAAGKHRNCPIYSDFMGKCFYHCNLDSEQICGDCVHWYGHCTSEQNGMPKYNSNGRHHLYGNCPFQIGDVESTLHNDCPHFHKRPEGFDLAMVDWVEEQVEATGIDPAIPEARPIRKKMRKEWFDMWDTDTSNME